MVRKLQQKQYNTKRLKSIYILFSENERCITNWFTNQNDPVMQMYVNSQKILWNVYFILFYLCIQCTHSSLQFCLFIFARRRHIKAISIQKYFSHFFHCLNEVEEKISKSTHTYSEMKLLLFVASNWISVLFSFSFSSLPHPFESLLLAFCLDLCNVCVIVVTATFGTFPVHV